MVGRIHAFSRSEISDLMSELVLRKLRLEQHQRGVIFETAQWADGQHCLLGSWLSL